MSYYEARPAVVDVDQGTEVEARVRYADELGVLVSLAVTSRSGEVVDLTMTDSDWRLLAAAVARQVRAEWRYRDAQQVRGVAVAVCDE